MDELDKILYHKLDIKEEIPKEVSNKIKKTVHYALYGEKTKKWNLPLRIVATACISLILTIGVVYAGKVIIDKIWKQPEKVVGFYSNQNVNVITQEEKNSVMSEKEAKEKVSQILKKFGHEGEKIKSIELNNNPIDYELKWYIELESGTSNPNIIEFDARGEDSLEILFNNALTEKKNHYRIAKGKVEETARYLCKKLGYSTEGYNKVEIDSNMETEKDSYLWHVSFYKEYDGIINPYESIHISFIPEVNEIYAFGIRNMKHEDNPVEINEEKARQIVRDTENKINTIYEIKNINVSLSIGKMNGDAYKRIENYEKYYEEIYNQSSSSEERIDYRTANIIRKIWKVTVEYDIPKFSKKTNYKPLYRYYTYYVDATTGEIIGGSLVK